MLRLWFQVQRKGGVSGFAGNVTTENAAGVGSPVSITDNYPSGHDVGRMTGLGVGLKRSRGEVVGI